MSKRRITGMNRRTGDKHDGERAGDRNVNERAGDGNGDEKTGDDYYFDKEDDYSEEASLYKPAPPVAQEEKSKGIKIEKLRRDDKGRVLSDEPVPMPKENLYYNSDGYIPQENVNYSRRADAAAETPKGDESGAFTPGTGDGTDPEKAVSESAEAGARAMEKAEAEIQAEAQKELSAEVEKIVSKEVSKESADVYASVPEEDILEGSAQNTEPEDLYFDEDDPPESELSEEGEYQEVYEAVGSEVLSETDSGSYTDPGPDPGFYPEEDITEASEETEDLPAEEGMPETGVYYEWGAVPETADLQTEEGTEGVGALPGGEDRSGSGAFPDHESLPESGTYTGEEIMPETAAMSEEEELDDPYDKYYKDSWVTKFVPPAAETQPASKAGRPKNKALVISLAGIGVVAAVFCGIMVALWDMEKSGEDLTEAIKGTYSQKLMQEYLAGMRVADQDAGYSIEFESLTEETQEAPEAAPEEPLEVSEEPSEEPSETPEASEPEPASEEAVSEEGGQGTDVEISGLTSIVDAGSGDEIEFAKTEPGGEEAAAVFEVPDPNANYPLEFRTVDYGYFLDALFIGDSRLQGFGMYADLPATYYCVTSFSVYKYDTMKVVQTDQGKKPIFDVLPYDMFTKIYIKVGLNEMGGNDDLFYEKYAELIAKLREYEPRAIIYVHAILPVSNAKSASDKYHNNPNIYARNEKLKQFALEQKAYYVDVNSALALEDGSLPPDAASDGIHLKAQYMGPWKESLREQAIVP
ncbi:MAG: hypothetical protein K5770_18900 [Lachnospiraceae bacterium]|nr:hypothetical protein [Lachnospiraceae bacterium]